MPELLIGMTRAALRKFAADITAACDEHPDDEGIKVERLIKHNGRGPALRLALDNDDMEGALIESADAAYYELDTGAARS